MLYAELISAPTDHWLWYTLSLTHYEQKEYETAYGCARRAVELQADCPLAIWHLAGSAYMTGRESAAAALWLLLLSKDIEDVAGGECGEGMDHAMQLLNDTHFRLGKYYQRQGNIEQARESFAKYLHNREHGVASTYDESLARELLGELEVAQA